MNKTQIEMESYERADGEPVQQTPSPAGHRRTGSRPAQPAGIENTVTVKADFENRPRIYLHTAIKTRLNYNKSGTSLLPSTGLV